MNVQEFDTALYHELYDFFYDHEFELNADKKQFRRRMPHGFQNVLFSVSELDEEIWLEVNLGIRIHAVEQIVQQFLDNSRAFWEDAMTVVISIGKLTNNKYFRYKIHTKEDLTDACDALKVFMLQSGFHFLENHSSLKALDQLFNHKTSKPTRYLYNQMHRCFKGAVIAKLNYNPKLLDIIDEYGFFLEKLGAKETLLSQYDRLADYLVHYSPN